VYGDPAILDIGARGNPGTIYARDASDKVAFYYDGVGATLNIGTTQNGGKLVVYDSSLKPVFRMDGDPAILSVGDDGNAGDIHVRDAAARDVFRFDGASATLTIGAIGNKGDIIFKDGGGRIVFRMNTEAATLRIGANGNEGHVLVMDSAGEDRIHLDGKNGDIKLMGGDLAEEFDSECPVEPGSVVVAVGPDEVVPASEALDRRLVGVASGAGDLRPGLRLGTRPGKHRVPVALVGRVYCQADAGHGAIAAGDLLTTSTTVGHAMRVEEPASAVGAIIGKALAPLSRGTGLIPVLLTQH
jgi:hypothetical protein